MTTIAYRDGIMAADSRVSLGEWTVPWCWRKIERLPDGRLCGFSGNPYKQKAFVEWLIDPSLARPDLGDDSKAIVVDKARLARFYQYAGEADFDGPFFATGCGAIPALAAMHAGAGAAEAVRIASLLDPYTGGDIHVEPLFGE